jgi:hypothetical protein
VYAVDQLGGTTTMIGELLDKMVAVPIGDETTGHILNRTYRHSPFIDLFTKGTAVASRVAVLSQGRSVRV